MDTVLQTPAAVGQAIYPGALNVTNFMELKEN